MNIFKKLFSKKPKKQELPKKEPECWYNNAHEQGENHDVLPFDAAGSPNLFEYGNTKNSANH